MAFDLATAKPVAKFDLATAKPVAEKAKERTFGEDLKRQLGLTARYGAEGITGLAGMVANVPSALINKALDVTVGDKFSSRIPDQNIQFSNLLTKAGLPEPETPEENIVGMASRGMAGAGGVAKVAGTLPGAISQAVAARPALQVVSGATGGAAAGTAAEMGAGPIGQMAAGLAGGIAPALATPRVPVMMRPRPQANAQAGAQVGPGVAAGESTATASPELRARLGGIDFGHVGADESAGLNSTLQRLADRGQAMGMRLTPGQATGSKSLQQLEAKLESQPMTSGPFNTIKARNATVVNRAAAHSIGETADVVDDVVLSRAANRIGQVFENVADDAPRQIEPRQFFGVFSEMQNEARGLTRGLNNNPLVEDLVGFAEQGGATGRQLQTLTSKLGKSALNEMRNPSGDRELGLALYRLKDYVDELLMQGLSPERAAALSEARGQYRNLMLLTQRAGNLKQDGNVSGRNLANTLAQKDKRGFLYGENQSPMYDAARFSQGFAPIVGDSGTATRMPFQGMTDFMMRVPMSLATRAYTSSPSVALAVRAQSGSENVRRLAEALANPVTAKDIPVGMVQTPQKRKK